MYFCLSVKFIIMPDGHVQNMTCSLKQSFSELRNHFSSEFNQPPQVILMIFDGMYGSYSLRFGIPTVLINNKDWIENPIHCWKISLFVSSFKSSNEDKLYDIANGICSKKGYFVVE